MKTSRQEDPIEDEHTFVRPAQKRKLNSTDSTTSNNNNNAQNPISKREHAVVALQRQMLQQQVLRPSSPVAPEQSKLMNDFSLNPTKIVMNQSDPAVQKLLHLGQ